MTDDDTLARYKKRENREVTAVQLRLDTDGFGYRKWGGDQRCKSGDWVVDNGGDVYTVDAETFRETYRECGPGRYLKVAPVWAERASQPGVIETREGMTRYAAGDWLVYNGAGRTDGYAMGAETFADLYEPLKEE